MMILDLMDQMSLLGKFDLADANNDIWNIFADFPYMNMIYTIIFVIVFIIILCGTIFIYRRFITMYIQLSERSSVNNEEPNETRTSSVINDEPNDTSNVESHEMRVLSTQTTDDTQEESCDTNVSSAGNSTNEENETGSLRRIPYYSDSQKSAILNESQSEVVDSILNNSQLKLNEKKKNVSFKKHTVNIKNHNPSRAILQVNPPSEIVSCQSDKPKSS